MTWLGNNIYWLIPALVAALSAINRLTVHWSEVQGPWWRRLLLVLPMFLIDLGSVLRSRGEVALTKMPLLPSSAQPKKNPIDKTPTKPDGLPPGAMALLLLSLTGFGAGCGSWKQATLKTTHAITRGVAALHEGEAKACKPVVASCRKAGCRDKACCPALVTCWDARAKAVAGLDMTMRSVLLVLIAVDLGDETTAVKAVVAALEAYRAVVEGLITLGVDAGKWRL